MMKKFDTIGTDLVSATTNDIIVLGAKPLTLLDYIANDKLEPETIEQIVTGMVNACQENDISLVGVKQPKCPALIYQANMIWLVLSPVLLKKIKLF